MATVISGNTIKLNDGKTVTAQQGGWYDGKQFWGGTLSAPGVINSQSDQIGAGQKVSDEVNRQSSVAQGKAPDAIKNYLNQQTNTPAQTSANKVASVGMPGAGSGAGMAGGGMPQAPQIDLKGIYDKLYKDMGIADKEAQITQSEKNYLEARNRMTNNPFLSVSNMDTRLARVRQAYEMETQPLKNEIATKKADIETRLALETKQFDINSQSTQQALSQFNTLLSMGALNSASGEDIASITRATGLSSGVIQSAIQNQIQSGYQTKVENFDDGTNEGFTVYTLDQMGNIINQSKQVTGKSKKTGQFDINSFINAFSAVQTPAVSTSNSSITSLWG